MQGNLKTVFSIRDEKVSWNGELRKGGFLRKTFLFLFLFSLDKLRKY